MPNRILRDWTDSDLVNQLTANAERMFVRLIMKVDDYGRQRAEPRMLRPLLYPLLLDHVREADLARWTAECEKAGLVRLYVVEDKQYLEVVNFGQRLRNCTRSKFPDPPPGCGHTAESSIRLHDGTSGGVDNHPRALPGTARHCPPEAESETEAEAHSEAEAQSIRSEPPTAASEPAVISFPIVGGGVEWPLVQSRIDRLSSEYPGVDVLAEARRARGWCLDNPSKRKTAKGMPAFLRGWVERCQNRGGSQGATNGKPIDQFKGARRSIPTVL